MSLVMSRSAVQFSRTLLFAVVSTIMMVASVLAAAGAAHASYQPCTNYRVTTQWGRVEVDTRPRDGDPIGGIAWAMFLNNIGDIPGRYDYQILVDGHPIETDFRIKDDNFHMTIPRYLNGRNRYQSGDDIQVIASHAAGKVLYVTPLNHRTVPYYGRIAIWIERPPGAAPTCWRLTSSRLSASRYTSTRRSPRLYSDNLPHRDGGSNSASLP